MESLNLLYRHGNRVPARKKPETRTCYECDGSGRDQKDESRVCKVCQGRGEL